MSITLTKERQYEESYPVFNSEKNIIGWADFETMNFMDREGFQFVEDEGYIVENENIFNVQ